MAGARVAGRQEAKGAATGLLQRAEWTLLCPVLGSPGRDFLSLGLSFLIWETGEEKPLHLHTQEPPRGFSMARVSTETRVSPPPTQYPHRAEPCYWDPAITAGTWFLPTPSHRLSGETTDTIVIM